MYRMERGSARASNEVHLFLNPCSLFCSVLFCSVLFCSLIPNPCFFQIDCTGSKVKSSTSPTSFCTNGSPYFTPASNP